MAGERAVYFRLAAPLTPFEAVLLFEEAARPADFADFPDFADFADFVALVVFAAFVALGALVALPLLAAAFFAAPLFVDGGVVAPFDDDFTDDAGAAAAGRGSDAFDAGGLAPPEEVVDRSAAGLVGAGRSAARVSTGTAEGRGSGDRSGGRVDGREEAPLFREPSSASRRSCSPCSEVIWPRRTMYCTRSRALSTVKLAMPAAA